MQKRGFVKVDWSKIEKVMKSNGLNQKDIADAMGYEHSWVTSVKSRGTMRKADAMHFKSIYGVDIEIHEEEDRMLKDEQSVSNAINVYIDTEKLGRAIGESLGRALNESLSTLNENLSNIIGYDRHTDATYTAIERVLNGEDDSPKREKADFGVMASGIINAKKLLVDTFQ